MVNNASKRKIMNEARNQSEVSALLGIATGKYCEAVLKFKTNLHKMCS